MGADIISLIDIQEAMTDNISTSVLHGTSSSTNICDIFLKSAVWATSDEEKEEALYKLKVDVDKVLSYINTGGRQEYSTNLIQYGFDYRLDIITSDKYREQYKKLKQLVIKVLRGIEKINIKYISDIMLFRLIENHIGTDSYNDLVGIPLDDLQRDSMLADEKQEYKLFGGLCFYVLLTMLIWTVGESYNLVVNRPIGVDGLSDMSEGNSDAIIGYITIKQ